MYQKLELTGFAHKKGIFEHIVTFIISSAFFLVFIGFSVFAYNAYTLYKSTGTFVISQYDTQGHQVSYGFNGVAESRCVNNMLHTIGPDGRMYQTKDENGHFMRCGTEPVAKTD